jgi:hypothetical protein
MAISSNKELKHLRGHIRRQLVIRYYAAADRIVISAFPNMDKVVFSKSQRDNQSKFKRAVAFASSVKSSEMLSFLFTQAFGVEISVYKEAIKQYFKNPEAPLGFLLDLKMQGCTDEGASFTLPSCPEERLELAEKHLANHNSYSAGTKQNRHTRRRNPNHRKYPLFLLSKI